MPSAAAPRQPLARMMVATPDAEHDLVAQLMAGEMALARTDLKAAAASFGRAMRLSRDPKVAARATELALAVHDDIAAQAAIDRWQALGAGAGDLAQARAELALDTGDTAGARRQLDRLLQQGGADAWRRFARVLMSARDPAEAGTLLESLATPARLPNDARAWLAIGELGQRLSRPAYALRIAGAAAARFKAAEAYVLAAHLRYASGDHAGAAVLLRQAMSAAPRNTQLRLAYASLLAQEGRYRQAAAALRQGPQNAQTYELRTALAVQLKDRAQLQALYRELQQAPANVRTHSYFLLGQLADSLDHPKQALDWYGRVSDEDPHAFDADLRTAVIEHQQGKQTQAHELLAQLETAYLDQPVELRRAYEADAAMSMVEQRYGEAVRAFSRALQIVPDDPALLYGRGLAYAENGQVDQAVADLRHLLRLRPGDVDASNALGYTLADADRDLPEARTLLQAARTARPNDPAIADSWGWLQYRLGHLGQAEQILRGAWAAGKDADVGVHLGVVLWHRGDQRAARAVFEQVRKSDPGNRALQGALRRLRP